MARRALVVDDSATIRRILGGMLRPLGFEVAEAPDGHGALAWMEREGAAELVLLDWTMPEMDGFAFLQALRARPETAAVRVMMVTAETDLGRVREALDAGADEYLMKPFTKETLASKLMLIGMGG